MKEIKAVIAPQRLAALNDAMRAVPGFAGMTVSRAEGYPTTAPRVRNAIRAELTEHVPRVRIEMVAPDEAAGALYDALVAFLSSGPRGDGLVWVTDVERVSFVHKTA